MEGQLCFPTQWGKRTPIAMMKFFCLFLSPRPFDMPHAQRYDVRVWIMKMNGMMARSTSFSAVNWEASFVKTVAMIS
jgi:hypothetical protein